MRRFHLICSLLAAMLSLSVSTAAFAAPAASARAMNGAIVYVGTDSNIYYCAGNCAEPQCLTCPVSGMHVRRDDGALVPAAFAPAAAAGTAAYGWPTFSPDGKRLAYSSTKRVNGALSHGLWIYDFAKHDATELFESRSQSIVYIDWLPDGQHLSFLLTEPRGLSLMLAEPKEGAPIRIVTSAMPLYFDWSRTPGTVALHTMALDPDRTEQVAVMSLTPTSQKIDRVLSRGRSPFKTPCWSPDGKHLAYIASYQAESSLLIADPGGGNPRSIVSLAVGDNSFVWSPDSKTIAYATALSVHEPAFQGLKLVEVASASARWITHDPVAAYFFAPDSRHLVYIAVPEDKPYYTWVVTDLKTGAHRECGNFITTPEEATAYRFFDQLAISHTIWAPDSSAFVYAGVRLFQMPEHPGPVVPPPSVWLVPVTGGDPALIGEGTIAFFAPHAAK
jgi:dipeptidyl aminopeptidase/acylaminoacyl peptidase